MSIKEYFLLSDAQAASKRVPEDSRVALARTLGVARRRAEAAERLWSNGHTAEGLRLAVDALAVTKRAVLEFGSASGLKPDAIGPILADRGLSKRRLEAVAKLEAELAQRDLPQLDDDVQAADGELFHQLIGTRGQMDRAVSPGASTPGQLAWTRNWRIGLTLLVIVSASAAAYLLTRRPEGVTAIASDYTNVYDGAMAIDGDEGTEWQLPDRTLGHVVITIEPPVRVDTLRLLNGHNRHYNDRGVRGYRVELFVDDEVVQTIDGQFGEFSEDPEWVEHDVDLDEVDQIRFNVRSHHRIGAALTEIAWQ